MDEPITDPRARDLIPAYVAGRELWLLRADMHRAADACDRASRSKDPEVRQMATAMGHVLRRAVNLANVAGLPEPTPRLSWWRRVLLALAS